MERRLAVADNAPTPDLELWEQLLQFIEEGRVVPVVGQDLLTVEIDGRPVLLYTYLAERLAASLGVGLPATGSSSPLSAVACNFLASGRDPEPERIYSELQRIVRGLGTLAPPLALKQLAAITPFSLYVSTTFDPLLEHALEAGGADVAALAYSPYDATDLPEDFEQRPRRIVFQLLGRVSSMPEYVVTEEDALEFVHALQAEGRPRRLFKQIHEKSLLIIGCRFPGWLVRSFIRTARRNRLLLARGKTDFVVDAGTRQDAALIEFLRSYRTRTQVFQSDRAVDFVAELHHRWVERNPAPVTPPPSGPDVPFFRPGTIFISYASEDRALVTRMAGQLAAAGMDVWFDREELVAGDAYEARIKRAIQTCSLFVPVLSRSCLTERPRRFFRREWFFAEEEAPERRRSRHFIVPLLVDDVPLNHPDFPEVFVARHVIRTTTGEVDAADVDVLRRDYREYQMALQGAV
jgi:TIR domain/SIR2-like domain